MNAANSPTQTSKALSSIWSLLAIAFALPWLIPIHAAPWTTFYQELFICAAFLPVACWSCFSNETWGVDRLAAGFLGAAVVPVAQMLYGMYAIPAEAPLVSVYLVGFSLTLLVAKKAEQISPGRLIDALFAGLVIGAIASTAIALYQWLQIDFQTDILASIPPGDRPVANVGQPNNLASLLAWGLLGAWWAFVRGRIHGLCALIIAAFILLGVALTQSRAGLLEVTMIAACAWVCRKKLGVGTQFKAWLGLALWFAALTLLLHPISTILSLAPTRELLDTGSPRERAMLLKMVLAAIVKHPWIGYGWNQTVTAHVALADKFPMHVTVGSAHNIFLDITVWNGIPLALTMSAGLLWWITSSLRRTKNPEGVLLLLGVLTLSVHAMLELPYLFAFFLVPVAILAGTFQARHPVGDVFVLNTNLVRTAVLLLSTFVVLAFVDYIRIESSAMDASLRAVYPGATLQPAPEPKIFVLQSLHQSLATLRTRPRRAMSAEELGAFRRTVTRYPTPSGLFRFAQSAALNGRLDDAKWALAVLCSLKSKDSCDGASRDWQQLGENGNPEMALVSVPTGP